MKSVKQLIGPTLALLIIGVVITAALSVTNQITKDRIAAQKEQALAQAMTELIPDATFALLQDQEGSALYEAKQGRQPEGYIVRTVAMGYKSEVEVLTAFDYDGRVTGVVVTDCADESPGIGQKIGTDQAFLDQYNGYTPDQTIDAITGATYSSDAVTAAVNSAIQCLQTYSSASSPKGGAAQ